MAVRPLSIRILGSAGVLPNIMILLYPLDKQGVIDNFLEVVLGKNIMPLTYSCNVTRNNVCNKVIDRKSVV